MSLRALANWKLKMADKGQSSHRVMRLLGDAAWGFTRVNAALLCSCQGGLSMESRWSQGARHPQKWWIAIP